MVFFPLGQAFAVLYAGIQTQQLSIMFSQLIPISACIDKLFGFYYVRFVVDSR